MQKPILEPLIIILLLSLATLCHSLPLSTTSRWIIDDHNRARVKLTCVNWAAHLEPMLAEGLDKRPLSDVVKHVKQMGFNCVRLTWATHMFTRYANRTVLQSFRGLGLEDAVKGLGQNNRGLMNMRVVDAHRAVIEELGRNGVMVVLDNHVSRPAWCCGDDDGNGFFGDRDFDAEEWLRGLGMVARRYRDRPMVVGMSLRNELRGPLQNITTWYNYIQKGATAVHEANPNLLVIVSGLHYDLSFTFLNEKPLSLNFKNKLVYEVHRYAFTAGQTKLWLNKPFTEACEGTIQGIQKQAGFLTEGENVAPLFVSEFGIKQVDGNREESLFLGCFLGYLVEMDLDWGVWALQGSYYVRDGVHGLDETYGMLNSDWSSVRNPDFLRKLQLVQQKIRDPRSEGSTYHILYHPSSGRCIKAEESEVHATDCRSFSRWNYSGSGDQIRLAGTELCLTAGGDGIPASLSDDCSSTRSQWELISSSNFQVANKDGNGKYLCLEWNPNNSSTIFTKKCICLERDDDDDDDDNDMICQQSPPNQWFKLISANAS